METIKFNKTECGVDFLINVLQGQGSGGRYLRPTVHNADYFEIAVFKKGNGELLLDDQIIPISDNMIVIISPFQKKKWKVDSENLDFILLVFQEDFLNEFFADKLFTYRLLYFYQNKFPVTLLSNEVQIESICNVLKEMKSELVSPDLGSAHIIRSLIYYLLQRLNRQYGIQNNLPYLIDTSNHAYGFKKMMEIHVRKNLRINDYCALMGISRITLNAAVKKQFNVTASELLKQRLLAEIKGELIYTNKTISEIGYDLGYSEPNHFMRFFKNQTGKTPSEFLAGYQNGRE